MAPPNADLALLRRHAGARAWAAAEAAVWVSVGGNITYPDSERRHASVRELPLANMLLETDAPYLAPYGSDGTRERQRAGLFASHRRAGRGVEGRVSGNRGRRHQQQCTPSVRSSTGIAMPSRPEHVIDFHAHAFPEKVAAARPRRRSRPPMPSAPSRLPRQRGCWVSWTKREWTCP